MLTVNYPWQDPPQIRYPWGLSLRAGKPRNYKREYREYHKKTKQKKRRTQRNSARRKMIRLERARKGDGKDVHHKNHNTADNRTSNLSVTSRKFNRSRNRRRP